MRDLFSDIFEDHSVERYSNESTENAEQTAEERDGNDLTEPWKGEEISIISGTFLA